MYNYGFRIHDPRLARFLSVDPLAPEYPWLTTYQYSSNSPVWMIDVDGLEGAPANQSPRDLRNTQGTVQNRHANSQNRHDNPTRGGGYTINSRQQNRKNNGKDYWIMKNSSGDRQSVSGDPEQSVFQITDFERRDVYHWDSENSTSNRYSMFNNDEGFRILQRVISIPNPQINAFTLRLIKLTAKPQHYIYSNTQGDDSRSLSIVVRDGAGNFVGVWGGESRGSIPGTVAAGRLDQLVITPNLSRDDQERMAEGKPIDFQKRVDNVFLELKFDALFQRIRYYHKGFLGAKSIFKTQLYIQ